MNKKTMFFISLLAVSNLFYASQREEPIAEGHRHRDECKKEVIDWDSIFAQFDQLKNCYYTRLDQLEKRCDKLVTQFEAVQSSGDKKLRQEFDEEFARLSEQIAMLQKKIDDMDQERRRAYAAYLADRAKFSTKK
jgi:hypothetical protein